MVCTCPGLDGVRGLAPPPRVDGHDTQLVVRVGLELHRGAWGAAHHDLREEITCLRLCPKDVAGCPGNLCELHSDAVAVFGVGLVDAGDFRSWRTKYRRPLGLRKFIHDDNSCVLVTSHGGGMKHTVLL